MTKIILTIAILSTSLLAELNWLKEAEKRLSWKDANAYCKARNAVLPTKKQFKTLWYANDRASDIPGFDISVSYWTSTELKGNKLAAFPFYFGEGRDDWYYKADHYGVRCIKK